MSIASKAEKQIESQTKLKGLITPDYSGLGLANIGPTILSHFGMTPKKHDKISPDFLDYGAFKGVKKVVFMLFDGMGYDMLLDQIRKNKSGGFSELVKNGQMFPITSVSPSTTVSALSSLHTGITPQEHGMLGYRMYLKEVKSIMNMISFQNIFSHGPSDGIKLSELFPFKTVPMYLKAAGTESFVITRNLYVESPMSMMHFRGSTGVPYVDSSHMFVRTRKILEQNHSKNTYVHMYWDRIDMVSHEYGKNSEEHLAEMQKIDFELLKSFIGKLSSQAKKDTLVLISADHGHINIPRKNLVNLGAHSALEKNLAIPPSGESRLAYLSAKKGKAQEVFDHLSSEFGKDALVMKSQELLGNGFFGRNEPHKNASSRIGDVVLLPKKNKGYIYPYGGELSEKQMIGRHGGMSKEEMLVPFIACRL